MSGKSESSDRHDECVEVIDTLHEMAHAGMFRNLSLPVLTAARDVLASFFDVDVSIGDVADHLGKSRSVIYNRISRRLRKEEKPKQKKLLPFRLVDKLK